MKTFFLIALILALPQPQMAMAEDVDAGARLSAITRNWSGGRGYAWGDAYH